MATAGLNITAGVASAERILTGRIPYSPSLSQYRPYTVTNNDDRGRRLYYRDLIIIVPQSKYVIIIYCNTCNIFHKTKYLYQH